MQILWPTASTLQMRLFAVTCLAVISMLHFACLFLPEFHECFDLHQILFWHPNYLLPAVTVSSSSLHSSSDETTASKLVAKNWLLPSFCSVLQNLCHYGKNKIQSNSVIAPLFVHNWY
jgi:hypothetical protein